MVVKVKLQFGVLYLTHEVTALSSCKLYVGYIYI